MHRKDGTAHKILVGMSLDELRGELDERRDEYVRLCFQCHSRVHWCMDRLGLTWDDIEKMVLNVRMEKNISQQSLTGSRRSSGYRQQTLLQDY